MLHQMRACYVCKRRFRRLHHFYACMCPDCADLNWRKRRQTADLTAGPARNCSNCPSRDLVPGLYGYYR